MLTDAQTPFLGTPLVLLKLTSEPKPGARKMGVVASTCFGRCLARSALALKDAATPCLGTPFFLLTWHPTNVA